jgi:hypothetical protein
MTEVGLNHAELERSRRGQAAEHPTAMFSLSSKPRSRFVILTLLVNRPEIT